MKKITFGLIVLAIFIFVSARITFSQSTDTQTQTTPKVCIVSGENIEEGQGLEFKYLDKTYNFCCKHCLAKFKKEPLNYIKVDLQCPVGGESASKDVSTTLDGVKYYFCCKMCIKKFESDPGKYLNK